MDGATRPEYMLTYSASSEYNGSSATTGNTPALCQTVTLKSHTPHDTSTSYRLLAAGLMDTVTEYTTRQL